MYVLWNLVKKNFKLLFLKKTSIIAFIVPVVFTLVCMQIGSMYSSGLKIGLIDKDNTLTSRALINSVKDLQGDKIKFVDADKDTDLKAKILQKDLDLAITVDEGFENSVKKGAAKEYEITAIKGSNVQNFTKDLVNFQIKNLNDLGKASLGNDVKFNEMVKSYSTQEDIVDLKSIKDVGSHYSATKSTVGVLIFFLLIRALATSSLVKKEREDNTYTRTFMAPVSSVQYLGANIIANAVILVIQILVVQIAMQYILKLDTGVSFGLMFLLLFLISLVAVGIGTLCIALFKDEQSISIFMNLIIMGTCMISGCFVPEEMLPNKVKMVALFTPQKWVMDGISKLQLGMTINDIALNIIILIAFAVALFMIAAFKMKISEKEYN
ncbi:ABC-2 type transport system permease protein [Clostridium cavendishii DSM 21758]|uniref:ABC-2 type transport system permease protein n=1 Tax=Clostridium cavendishii DSM 21758 TaxID=1121302 RepID=A0A1M6J5R4_9CLOT|nr:ABC transporter permease [Clostridium cavendishii]SHJ42023.1 ABC-2 type transport system permease protein [Clostridium cavendishii DSM 21758]